MVRTSTELTRPCKTPAGQLSAAAGRAEAAAGHATVGTPPPPRTAPTNAPENALERHRRTLAEYRRPGETGTLAPAPRVEPIDGEIAGTTPIGPAHAAVVHLPDGRLARAVGDAAIVRVRNPIELSERSEPEPDLALPRPRTDHYRPARPRPADVLLVVEVADSTLARERDVKRALYARYGVPEYWIVDVGGERVTLFREPSGERYAREETPDDLRAVAVGALDGVRVDLSGAFG